MTLGALAGGDMSSGGPPYFGSGPGGSIIAGPPYLSAGSGQQDVAPTAVALAQIPATFDNNRTMNDLREPAVVCCMSIPRLPNATTSPQAAWTTQEAAV